MKGERLKQLRKEQNLSQQELADKLGITRGTLGNYETGERIPSEEILIKIADYFDVSIDYLLGEKKKTPLA